MRTCDTSSPLWELQTKKSARKRLFPKVRMVRHPDLPGGDGGWREGRARKKAHALMQKFTKNLTSLVDRRRSCCIAWSFGEFQLDETYPAVVFIETHWVHTETLHTRDNAQRAFKSACIYCMDWSICASESTWFAQISLNCKIAANEGLSFPLRPVCGSYRIQFEWLHHIYILDYFLRANLLVPVQLRLHDGVTCR